jgi:hypothetical protein
MCQTIPLNMDSQEPDAGMDKFDEKAGFSSRTCLGVDVPVAVY